MVFAHGIPGKIMLGYDYNREHAEFTISMDDLVTDKIKTFDAFNNPNTMFYSCNTGTDISEEWGSNFAQKWVDLAGGTTWAYVGKTDYSHINDGESWSSKWSRRQHGFSYCGSNNYPTGSNNAWVNTFYRR